MADSFDMIAHLGVNAVRAGWYTALRQVTARVSRRLGQAPLPASPRGQVPSTARLLGDLARLLIADAEGVRDGLYPPPQGNAGWFVRELERARAMLLDLPAATRRRLARDGREVVRQASVRGLPDYFLQNFHYQTGGYLTEQSARLYDTQVETLFLGAADAMRRQALRPIAAALRGRDQRNVLLLDVACGTGRMLDQVLNAFPALTATGTDLSFAYLREAARTLRARRRVRLVLANAETLPLADASQDIATCVFLFHELPRAVRGRVAREIARVLKPGGIFVFIDSLQTGDEPAYDGLLEVFPMRFHEPYYADYLAHDLDGMLTNVGLARESTWTAFLSKVMVRRRSAS